VYCGPDSFYAGGRALNIHNLGFLENSSSSTSSIVFSYVRSIHTTPQALFGCDGTVPLSHTNDHFKTERSSFSQQKRDSDTLMAARSQPNDNWGSVGNGAKHGEKHVGGGSGM